MIPGATRDPQRSSGGGYGKLLGDVLPTAKLYLNVASIVLIDNANIGEGVQAAITVFATEYTGLQVLIGGP